MDRVYGLCRVCGNLVYRKPGQQHGDGQIDDDDNPVWLLDCQDDDPKLSARLKSIEAEGLTVGRITCGCND